MTFSEIGLNLKKAREAKGFNLETIHENNKIPVHYLQAIEEGNHDIMPEPVYVNGFIKRFAEALNLDAFALANDYKNWVNSIESPKHEALKNSAFMHNSNVVNPQPIIYKPKPENHGQNLFKVIYYPLILIPIMILLVVFLYNKQVENIVSQSPNDAIDIPNNLTNKPPESGELLNSNSKDLFAPETASNSNNTLKIKAKQHVWVTVRNAQDNEALLTGFLEAGDERSFDNNKGLKIRVGNGGNVEFTYLDKTQMFGTPGSPCERTIPPPATVASNVAPDVNSSTDRNNLNPLKTTAENKSPDSDTKTVNANNLTTSKPTTKIIKPKAVKVKKEPMQSDIKRVLDVPYRYTDE